MGGEGDRDVCRGRVLPHNAVYVYLITADTPTTILLTPTWRLHCLPIIPGISWNFPRTAQECPEGASDIGMGRVSYVGVRLYIHATPACTRRFHRSADPAGGGQVRWVPGREASISRPARSVPPRGPGPVYLRARIGCGHSHYVLTGPNKLLPKDAPGQAQVVHAMRIPSQISN